MSDANTICHDVDLLGDWLDAKGFTEEAGLCLRVLGLIHAQAEENEKTKRFYIEAGFELRQLREDNKRLRAALSELVGAASRVNMRTGTEFYTAWRAAYDITKGATIEQSSIVQSPAAAALKETGDE